MAHDKDDFISRIACLGSFIGFLKPSFITDDKSQYFFDLMSLELADSREIFMYVPGSNLKIFL